MRLNLNQASAVLITAIILQCTSHLIALISYEAGLIALGLAAFLLGLFYGSEMEESQRGPLTPSKPTYGNLESRLKKRERRLQDLLERSKKTSSLERGSPASPEFPRGKGAVGKREVGP